MSFIPFLPPNNDYPYKIMHIQIIRIVCAGAHLCFYKSIPSE